MPRFISALPHIAMSAPVSKYFKQDPTNQDKEEEWLVLDDDIEMDDDSDEEPDPNNDGFIDI